MASRRWQGKVANIDPLVPYIDTFGYDLPKPWPRGAPAPAVPCAWEATSPLPPRESITAPISPSLFETTDIEELRETIVREEKERAAEAWAAKEMQLQEKIAAKDQDIKSLQEKHQLQCEALLTKKEQEIQDVLREERLQQEELKEKAEIWLQDQLCAKEREIQMLKEEQQFQKEELLRKEQAVQQMQHEERAETKENARAVEKLQEQLVQKDVLIDALKEESRMKHEEVLRKDMEMKEALHEEQLRNQELRDMIILEENEKATNLIATKEKELKELRETLACEEKERVAEALAVTELKEKVAAKDQEIKELQDKYQLQYEALEKKKEQEIKLREERLQQEDQLGAKEMEIQLLKEERQFHKEQLLQKEHAASVQQRAENQENARAVEKLQEQLVEKDVLIDALKEESRMKHEDVLRKDAEMKEALREEQFRNQELREMIVSEENEKATQLIAMKEKDFQELEALLAKERKDNEEIQDVLRQDRLQQQELEALLAKERKDNEEIQDVLRQDRLRQQELEALLAQERKDNEELRAEMIRFNEQNTAQVFEKEAKFELELAEASDQKVSLEAQLAALIQRLDEEQAERIRQGARAESLERDLKALHAQRLEEQELKRVMDSQSAWLRLVQRLATEAELSSLRSSQRCLQRDVTKLRRDNAQDEARLVDLATCVDENEKLLSTNRELSSSLQHFKQENEQLQIDNRSLVESVALFEADLEKVSDRHAQLIGHVNKKQKIRYTVKLKEECAQLRLDLNKARHRLNQLEGSRRTTDNLFGALASLGYEREPLDLRSAGRSSAESKRLQECALERVNADFRHLVSLVQSALAGDGVDRSTADFSELLQALRTRCVGQGQGMRRRAPVSRASPMSPASASPAPKSSPLPPSPALQVTPPRAVSTAAPRKAALFLEDQENLASAQNCEDSDQLREAKKALLQINQCIGSGRKLYGQPVADSWGFFQVLQRKGAIDRKDVSQGLRRLDITLSQNTMDALIHALDSGHLGSCWN